MTVLKEKPLTYYYWRLLDHAERTRVPTAAADVTISFMFKKFKEAETKTCMTNAYAGHGLPC